MGNPKQQHPDRPNLFRAGDTVSIVALASPQGALALPIAGDTVMFQNSGAQVVFVRWGNSSITVTPATGVVIFPNTNQLFPRNEATHFAAILEAGSNGSARMNATCGDGDV